VFFCHLSQGSGCGGFSCLCWQITLKCFMGQDETVMESVRQGIGGGQGSDAGGDYRKYGHSLSSMKP
jgi:hypothetical protein